MVLDNIGQLARNLVVSMKDWGVDDKDGYVKTFKEEFLRRVSAAVAVPLAALADALAHLGFALGNGAAALLNKVHAFDKLKGYSWDSTKTHLAEARADFAAATSAWIGFDDPAAQRGVFRSYNLIRAAEAAPRAPKV